MTTRVSRVWAGLFASPLRRNMGYTLGRQLLAALAQLLLVVLIARSLGPEGNGRYALAILLPSLMVNMLNLGIGPATVYYVGRQVMTAHQAVLANSRLGLVIGTIGAFLAIPAIYSSHEMLFPGVPKATLLIGLATFPVSLLLAFLNTVLQGLEDFRAFNWSTVVPPYVTFFLTGSLLYAIKIDVETVVMAYFFGQVAGLLVTILFLRGKWLNKQPDGVVTGSITGNCRKLLGYGWKAHLSNILAFVNYRADVFLVNFFMNPAATGVYVIAVQIAERLWMLSQAASTVLLPRLSAMHQDTEARLRLTQRGFRVVVLLTAGVSVMAVVALYWLLVPVFGEEFTGALGAFLWLLPGIIAGAGARIQSNCIAAAGKPEWNFYVSLIVVTINIIGNIILIPLFGILGAAMATSLAYMINAFIKFVLIKNTLTL